MAKLPYCFLMACVLALPGIAQRNATTKASTKASSQSTQSFGGTYSTLLPAQKRLIDEYFKRASAALGKPIPPAEGFDNLRISVRTTFDAVTHALAKTKLTDKAGKKYGTALDLVDLVEEVAGEKKGAGGDEQFRIYVLLKPKAFDILSKAKEFERKSDNTIYHKSYPICFRSTPAVPSIQFSLTRDYKQADIDVDYRSSKFPAAVVNGHLTASNSDVRAGNNLDRHDSRWTGLSAWWQNLFGLIPSANAKGQEQWVEQSVPEVPKGDPDQMTHDFLEKWLVQRNMAGASAYFSHQIYPCVEAATRKSGGKVGPGIGAFVLLMQLSKGAKAVGNIDTISAAVRAPENPYAQLKPMKNKYNSEFLLLNVPSGEADEFRCDAAKSTGAAKSDESGDYAASIMSIQPENGQATEVMLLWQKESKTYRIVSARLAKETGNEFVAYGTKRPEAAPPAAIPVVEGSPQFNSTLNAFFTTWLLKNEPSQAATYFATSSYACLSPEKVAQGNAAIVNGLDTIRKTVGNRESLNDYLKPITPDDPYLKRVVHAEDSAYPIFWVPGSEAAKMNCSKKKLPAGSYYGTVYRFRTSDGDDPATVYMLWGERDKGWKVVAWRIIDAD